MQRYSVSQRFACQALGVHRSSARRSPTRADDEEALTKDIIRLAGHYGRYGYRRITALLKSEGWHVNHKRVERIWREQSLKVPKKQPKRKRLYLNDGSCIRLKPLYLNHVWSYDFVSDRLSNGKKIRMLTIIDEYSRECLSIRIDYKLKSDDVLDELSTLFLIKGMPDYIRSDNGSEFTSHTLQEWLKDLNVKTAFIEPGSPWENGYNERFNGSLRDECLNLESFDTLKEARVIVGEWVSEYNHIRPHSSLGYKPPAPLAIVSDHRTSSLATALPKGALESFSIPSTTRF
jgi:putative transposase